MYRVVVYNGDRCYIYRFADLDHAKQFASRTFAARVEQRVLWEWVGADEVWEVVT